MRALFAIVFTSVGLCFLASGNANDRANASFYIDTYGTVDSTLSVEAARAQAVFKKLKRASSIGTASSKLVIIDSGGKPWALALADGNVILSHGALEIIYSSSDLQVGDAWLAFVLGHELAHLGSRDLWHQHVYASLSALSDEDSNLADVQQAMTSRVFDEQAWREKELKADEVGYVIASLAGFEVERIFGDRDSRGFLAVWEEQTQSRGNTHYGADVRTEFLRLRVKEAEARLDQFQLGVMLAHFGRFADALNIFEDFQSFFSSAEVLSNLGYVHLQLARKGMPSTIAYRFWLPTLLEPFSGVRTPSRSIGSELPAEARMHLDNAVLYLESALELNPENISASANLATTYQYLGKYHRSRAVVEDALEFHPFNTHLIMLRYLALLEQEPEIDMWSRVVQGLEAIEHDENVAPQVLFNLMRLHIERERNGKATQLGTQLLSYSQKIPPTYREQICVYLGTDCSFEDARHSMSDRQFVNRERYPLLPGDALNSAKLQKNLLHAERRVWQVQEISGTTIKMGAATAYAFDGVVELVKYPIENFKPIDSAPVRTTAIGKLRLSRYKSGVTVVNQAGLQAEIWLGIQ